MNSTESKSLKTQTSLTSSPKIYKYINEITQITSSLYRKSIHLGSFIEETWIAEITTTRLTGINYVKQILSNQSLIPSLAIS